MLLTLFPSRYRNHEGLSSNAIACGVLQTFIALILLVFRLFDFVANNSDRLGERSEMVWDHIGGGAVYGSGVLVIAEIAFHPVSIIGYYFVFEGVVRTMAALVGHQTNRNTSPVSGGRRAWLVGPAPIPQICGAID
jgi:hypothetical protein